MKCEIDDNSFDGEYTAAIHVEYRETAKLSEEQGTRWRQLLAKRSWTCADIAVAAEILKTLEKAEVSK